MVKMSTDALAWIGLLYSVLCSLTVVDCNPTEERLLAELFKNREYNRQTSPATSINDTIHVKLQLAFGKIAQVDAHEEVFRALYWYFVSWKDYRLKWNASEFDGLETIFVPVADVWNPEILLFNSAQTDGEVTPQSSYILLEHTGVCKYWPFNDVSVSHCPLDIRWFPFDEQSCQMQFETWKYDSRAMILNLDDPPVNWDYFQKSGEWELVDITAASKMIAYDNVDYSRLVFTVHMRRKALYYVINFIVPCLIFSALCIVSLLKPPTEERVGLGMTILLTLSFYQMIVNASLPTTSDKVPLLGVLFLFVMILCGISVAITILLMYLRHLDDIQADIPVFVKRFVCGHLASILRIKKSKRRPPSDQEQAKNTKIGLLSKDNGVAEETELTVHQAHGKSVDTVVGYAGNGAGDEQSVENGEIAEDWMLVSLVLDRLTCGIVFVCMVVGICVILMLPIFCS